MDKNLKMVSTCCYVRDKDKILMLYRNKMDAHSHKRSYRGLGGKAEQGESPIDCVKREIKEEAGIDINPIWKGIVTFSNPTTHDWEAHIFVAEGFLGQVTASNEGELIWVDEKDIFDLEMPEGDKKLMPLLFEKDKFHAHLKYDNNKRLIDCKIDII